MNPKKVLSRALSNPTGLRFADACRLAEAFGFEHKRTSGSHHIFAHSGIPELVNLQNVKGMAKAYQVRQLLKLVERYNLQLEAQN
jgi:predicted RNA binding protein YcfA (HicA-like mRNA interferase family)